MVPLAELRCRADARAGTLTCDGSGAGGGAARDLTIVGGQHYYVRLASGGTAHDAGTDVLSSTVTVQNLLLAAMGTGDGATPHPAGIRVFFATPPSNGVTVQNATGTGTFTAGNQDYFMYSGAELGSDGILASNEVSAGKEWRFALNGATSFAFTLYVQAEVAGESIVHLNQVQTSGLGEISDFSCGLSGEGKAYCWGNDLVGQLGNGASATEDQGIPFPVAMPAGATFTVLTVGSDHACALGSNGKAYCWGWDYNYQIGDGNDAVESKWAPTEVILPAGVTFTAISAGGSHTCALGSNAKAYCWGDNDYGELGNGVDAYDEEDHLADNQPQPVEVVMPTGVTFTTIAAGFNHTCALGSDGKAYCWGRDSSGQLGVGDENITSDAEFVPTEVLDSSGVAFTSITGGFAHTCALASTGDAYCWGADSDEQLGDGADVDEEPSALAAVVMPAGVAFTSISAGGDHTCALGSNGKAYCWGDDFSGGLGNGEASTEDQPVPSEVLMPAGVTFTSISAGEWRTCAGSAGASYCWGRRMVGDGTAVDRHAPVRVAGTK